MGRIVWGGEVSRLPPYAKQLKRSDTNLYICCGKDGWKFAQFRREYYGCPAIVLPNLEDPARYKWPVAGREVVVRWPDGDYASISRFCELLVRSGARLVVAPFEDDENGFLTFRPERREAA